MKNEKKMFIAFAAFGADWEFAYLINYYTAKV